MGDGERATWVGGGAARVDLRLEGGFEVWAETDAKPLEPLIWTRSEELELLISWGLRGLEPKLTELCEEEGRDPGLGND